MSTIVAKFNYLAPIERLTPPEPPFRYVYPPPRDRPEHNEVLDSYRCQVRDIRDHKDKVGLDRTGFGVLFDAPTAFADWDDETSIRERYYAETIRLLQDRLAASRIIVFDHTIRRRNKTTDDVPDRLGKRQPVFRVHIDQTPQAGEARVLAHAGEDGVRLSKTRCQIINVWRALRGPIKDSPLGLIDFRTVGDKDLAVGRLLYRDREGSTFLVHHNPLHQWYYLSDMQPDEPIMIKCFDNKVPKAVAPHSGFAVDVPDGVGYLPRHSIELRCLVFYERESVQ